MCYNFWLLRGIAQPGSAPALGAGGRGFESLCPDQDLALVAHLDRASAF
jgi:hypothetical protein